jgi:hypothetical protein
MSDSSSEIFKARREKVASLLGLGDSQTRVWRPEELAAVFRHQMAAPVSVDLAALGPAPSQQLRTLADASGLLLKSFRDLFEHQQPPQGLLQLVKEFAKLNRHHPDSLIPGEVASVLYYMSIAAALVRRGERLTSLTDEKLREGFAWAKNQDWVDEQARCLLGLAENELSKSPAPG